MTDLAWLSWAIPATVFVLGLAVHWGVAEARMRGLQYQVNELRKVLSEHLADAPTVRETLARLDERTEIMGKRMERIENRLNGG